MNKLAAELDIHKAIDSIRSFILELLGCESVTLFLVDSENKSVRQAANRTSWIKQLNFWCKVISGIFPAEYGRPS